MHVFSSRLPPKQFVCYSRRCDRDRRTVVVAIGVLHSVVSIFPGVGWLSAPNPGLRGSLCGIKMSAFMVCVSSHGHLVSGYGLVQPRIILPRKKLFVPELKPFSTLLPPVGCMYVPARWACHIGLCVPRVRQSLSPSCEGGKNERTHE